MQQLASKRYKGKNNPSYKHGHSTKGSWSKEYRCWAAIKSRCLNKNCRAFDLYGGRGILMSKDWIDNFEIFLKEVGQAPSPKHELDRINVNGNYEKDNCRWATRKEQMRNIRKNCLLTFEGITLTAMDWSEKLGVNPKTIYTRKSKNWSDYECLKGRKNG